MKTDSLNTIPLSAMSAVFADKAPDESERDSSLTMLCNETASFQLAFCISEKGEVWAPSFELIIESPIEKYIAPYVVGNVAAVRIGYAFSDDWFLRKTPGVYPDYLRKIKNGAQISSAENVWQSIFFNINENAEDIPSGTYDVKVTLKSCQNNSIFSTQIFKISVIDAKLPKQSVTATNWMHYDCMCHFASCKPFSAKFWKVFKSYATLAAKNGQNMILTPAFTPPLDTAVNAERPTVQLVDVEKTSKGYEFDFSKLAKFIEISLECGIEKFEHSHMFTQWGAKHTPKIIVKENGKNIKKFGWHTDATSAEYAEFLTAYVTSLKNYLLQNGWTERFFFHISDEPTTNIIESYSAASKLMNGLLGDLPSGDALSEVDFATQGVVRTPIAVSRTIQSFLGKTDNLWIYYTGAESKDYLSNRLIGMPAERNRILGLQIYYYNIKGFLQWAFNAHHTRLCESFINPYKSSESNLNYVAGTSYLVYPETDGATPSLRLMYFRDSMQDIRACALLESLTSREYVISIIERIIPNFGIKCKITAEQMIKVRQEINAQIAAETEKVL